MFLFVFWLRIGHPLSMYVTRVMEGVIQNVYRCVQGESGKAKHQLRVTSSNPRFTSSNSRVKRIKARVARLKARVSRLKAQVGRLKARVEAIKPRVR